MASPKRKRRVASPVEARVRRWLRDAGYSVVAGTPDPANEFELTISYPQWDPEAELLIVRPRGRRVLGFLMSVGLPKEMIDVERGMEPGERDRIMHLFRRTAYAGGLVGFGARIEDDVLTEWDLEVSVHDDALSEHALHASLRALFLKHLELIEVVDEHIGDAYPKTPKSTMLTGYG